MTRKRLLLASLVSLTSLSGYGVVLVLAQDGGRDELSALVLGEGEARPRLRLLHGPSERVSLGVDGRALPGAVGGALPGNPGRHLARLSSRYLGRRPRVLGWSYLVPGREPPEGGWLPGAVGLWVSQSQLDGPGPDDLASTLSRAAEALLRRELSRRSWVEKKAVALLLGALRQVRVRLGVVDDGLSVRAAVHFALGEARLAIALRGRLHMGVSAGRLRLRRGALHMEATPQGGGGAWARLRHRLAGKILARLAPRRVEAAVGALLPRLEALMVRLLGSELALDTVAPSLVAHLRPRTLSFHPGRGLWLQGDMRLHASRGPVVPAALLVSPATPVALPPSPAPLAVSLDMDVINAGLAAAWASKALDAVGAQGARQVRAALSEDLARLLAFEVSEVRLRAAPMVMPASGSRRGRGPRLFVGPLRLRLSLAAGEQLPAAVDLHGAFPARLELRRGQQLTISLRSAPIASSCGEGTSASPLRPCFDEFVGLANGWLAAQRPLVLPIGPGPGWGRWRLAMPTGSVAVRGRIRAARIEGRRLLVTGRLGFDSKGL